MMKRIRNLSARLLRLGPWALVIAFFAGIFAWGQLRQELVPDVEFPVMTVTAVYPGADPGAALSRISFPLRRRQIARPSSPGSIRSSTTRS